MATKDQPSPEPSHTPPQPSPSPPPPREVDEELITYIERGDRADLERRAVRRVQPEDGDAASTQ
jgi:hypothetical protein